MKVESVFTGELSLETIFIDIIKKHIEKAIQELNTSTVLVSTIPSHEQEEW